MVLYMMYCSQHDIVGAWCSGKVSGKHAPLATASVKAREKSRMKEA